MYILHLETNMMITETQNQQGFLRNKPYLTNPISFFFLSLLELQIETCMKMAICATLSKFVCVCTPCPLADPLTSLCVPARSSSWDSCPLQKGAGTSLSRLLRQAPTTFGATYTNLDEVARIGSCPSRVINLVGQESAVS